MSLQDMIRQYITDEFTTPVSTSSLNKEDADEIEEIPLSLTETNMKQDKDITMINIPASLQDLYNECLNCTKCELCQSATNLVFGIGSDSAELMIIGEAPGASEDLEGIPFVGRAGQLLTKTLNKYGVNLEEVYIANILKHRPPQNRNPLPIEIEACTPFLKQQIAIVKPKLLLTLGNFSSQFILNTKTGITKIRGIVQESDFGMVLPTLHPSAIIRGAYPIDLFENDIVTALKYVGYTIDTDAN